MADRELFGGAMVCALPESFVDLSNFRSIPQNQEVFADMGTDASVIFELVEYQQDCSEQESARFFFQDLADANEATEGHEILECVQLTDQDLPNITSDFPKSVAIGLQRVAKFNETAKNTILVYLVNIRLPRVSTDVLITTNIPLEIHPESSSAGTYAFRAEDETQPGINIVRMILQSFAIHDWGIFGQ